MSDDKCLLPQPSVIISKSNEKKLVISMDDKVISIGHSDVEIELAIHKGEGIAISYWNILSEVGLSGKTLWK